jgi:hypothetical protein
VIWSICFFFISSHSPDTHRFISEREKIYIKSQTKETLKSTQVKLVNNSLVYINIYLLLYESWKFDNRKFHGKKFLKPKLVIQFILEILHTIGACFCF